MELTTSFLMCKEWHGEAQNKHYFQFSLSLCSIWQMAHIQIVFLLINQTLGYLSSFPIGQTTMFDEGLWYGVLIIKPWQIAASVYLHQNQEIRQVLIKEVWLCPMDMQCMLAMKCNCLCLSLKHHRALEAHLYLYFKWSYKFLTCVNMYVLFTCLMMRGERS